jgi:hypothetical protein
VAFVHIFLSRKEAGRQTNDKNRSREHGARSKKTNRIYSRFPLLLLITCPALLRGRNIPAGKKFQSPISMNCVKNRSREQGARRQNRIYSRFSLLASVIYNLPPDS